MFPNVGKELKNWAKFFFIITLIPFCLAALGALISVTSAVREGGFFLGLIAGGVIAAIGYFVARLSSILLYAFGELVDTNMEINKKLSAQAAPAPQPTYNPQPAPAPQPTYNPQPAPTAPKPAAPAQGSGWFCMQCGTKNDPDARFCYKCGGTEKQ